MVGLVNSAGAYSAWREQAAQSTRPATATTRELGEPPMWIRPHEVDTPNRSEPDAVSASAPQAESTADPPPAESAHEDARREGPGPSASGLGQLIDVSA